MHRNFLDERFRPGRLAGAGRPRYQDVAAAAYRETQKRLVFAGGVQPLSSASDHTSLDGRRIVMATHPRVVAGGSTICTRSPVGSDADRSGADSSTRCRLAFAMSFASRWHQSKSANGAATHRQPERVSTKTSR